MMMFGWTRNWAHWIAMVAFALASHTVRAESIAWTEDARLHDDRSVTVQIEGNSAALPYYLSYKKSSISQFKLVFRHPDTQQDIVWQGARYFSPVLLDVVQGVPYLVVYGRPTQATRDAYGCPELPYIFLRHGVDGWQSVSAAKAPPELRSANLYTYQIPLDTAGHHLIADAVSQHITAAEQQTSGLLQKAIPRALADWHALNRRSALNDRLVGDCRPPPAELTGALVLPPPAQAAPELLETVDYVPETAYSLKDWNQLSIDTRRTDACKPMFQSTEVDAYNLDMRFTQDKTRTKRVPYTQQGAWEPGVSVLCDTHLWFITSNKSAQTLTLTQFTQSGDPVFRVAFAAPANAGGWVGTFLWPTLRADAEYLYFDWALGRTEGAHWLVKRVLKMRVPLKN